LGDKIKNNVMGGAYRTYRRRELHTILYNVLMENIKERDHLEDLGVERKIILKRIFKT
jgi:hypothetical protein